MKRAAATMATKMTAPRMNHTRRELGTAIADPSEAIDAAEETRAAGVVFAARGRPHFGQNRSAGECGAPQFGQKPALPSGTASTGFLGISLSQSSTMGPNLPGGIVHPQRLAPRATIPDRTTPVARFAGDGVAGPPCNVQPLDQPWNYQGMGNNLAQTIAVTVR